jgi:hypothetical protein
MININEVLIIQSMSVKNWHHHLQLVQKEVPWIFIEENTSWNFKLWHEEDIARILDIEPERIMTAKRNIDKYNQQRNDSMEKIDEWILSYLLEHNITMGKKLHSETPGMIIDRLSIMALKIYHMQEQTERKDASEEHIKKCQQKVWVLKEQIGDLANCLSDVLSQIEKGQLQFKIYRQFKMYNDPTLNPQLYGSNMNL